MYYKGADRDVILKKESYLILSGNFNKNIYNIKNNSITGINSILNFDYMWSSEFDSDILYKSLRRMTLNKDFYIVIENAKYKNETGNTLKAYVPKMYLVILKKILIN